MADRKVAARKGARTRAANAASSKYIEEVVRPGHERLNAIVSDLLYSRDTDQAGDLRLRWKPCGSAASQKLKHGVTKGTLVGFRSGFYLKVLPDGYRNPKTWHPAFWELIRGGDTVEIS